MLYKVYANKTELIATAKYGAIAATIAGIYGPTATVKAHGRIVWREGSEEFTAIGNSNRAADVMLTRIRRHHNETMTKYHARQTAALA